MLNRCNIIHQVIDTYYYGIEDFLNRYIYRYKTLLLQRQLDMKDTVYHLAHSIYHQDSQKMYDIDL